MVYSDHTVEDLEYTVVAVVVLTGIVVDVVALAADIEVEAVVGTEAVDIANAALVEVDRYCYHFGNCHNHMEDWDSPLTARNMFAMPSWSQLKVLSTVTKAVC